MALCDLCGKDTQLIKSVIERATLRVCSSCASYGAPAPEDEPKRQELKEAPEETPKKDIPKLLIPSNEDLIDDNYALLVKKAREKLSLTQEQLAKAIAEKENIIHRIETKQQEPPLKVAKKLEQYLRIKLIVKEQPQKQSALKNIDFSETDLTIGDLVEMQKKLKDS